MAREKRIYCVLWKWEEAEDLEGKVVTEGRGRHSGGLQKGDRVFVWATKNNELYLLGALLIERSGKDWMEGKSLYGKFTKVPLGEIKWKLCFYGSRERLRKSVNLAMQVRSRRVLRKETAPLLEGLLDVGKSLLRRQTQRQGSIKKNFTLVQIKEALRAIEGTISGPQRDMLLGHYEYRSASMHKIAQFGGYSSYGAANLHYGALARQIAHRLRFQPPGNWTYTIAALGKRDQSGDIERKLDDVVVRALEELGWVNPCSSNLPERAFEAEELPETTRDQLTQARIGQGKFRSDLFHLWRNQCAVTGCSMERLLIASHIKPWRSSNNKERLDPHNGLLLTPNLDKLFDSLLITFNGDGTILLSKTLSEGLRKQLGISEKNGLRFVRPQMKPYLQWHRRLFDEQEQDR